MSIVSEAIEFDGRQLHLTWMPGPSCPPREQTTQASGVCFVGGQVVLVSSGDGWSLPGGHPESGESIEEALVREFAEEASGRIVGLSYLGAVCVEESGAATCYQVRFWARAELNDFQPNTETVARRLVAPTEVAGLLAWKNMAIMHATLDAALAMERHGST